MWSILRGLCRWLSGTDEVMGWLDDRWMEDTLTSDDADAAVVVAAVYYTTRP